MPNYKLVPIQGELDAVFDGIQKAKNVNRYDAKKDQWNQAVLFVLKKQCKLAEDHRKAHAEYVMERRNKCKGIVDDMEVQLKKKNLIAGEYAWLEKQPAVLAALATESNDDSGELTKALVQYRGGWPAKAKECLSDDAQSLVQSFRDTREDGINNEDKVLIGYRKRCDEYVTRAQEFAKQAVQRQKKGAVDVEEFNQDVAEIKQKMLDGNEKIAGDRQKKHRLFEFFDEVATKKTWSDAEKKQASVYFPQIESIAKEARGTVKTLTTLLDGLEARGKAAGPGWKDIAAKAVKSAKEDHAKAKASAESITEAEERYKKVMLKQK